MGKKLTQQLMVALSGFMLLAVTTWFLLNLLPDNARQLILNSAQASDILSVDFFYYLQQLSNFDFGHSAYSGADVMHEFMSHFPATLELVIIALGLALVLGIPLGIYAAQHKNSWKDQWVVSSTLIGYSLPVFWWGILLILLFSLYLNWTPVAGRIGFEYDIETVTGFILIDTLLSDKPYSIEAFWDSVHHLILPAVTLATMPLAVITRVTRTAMIESLQTDYIKLAIAKGIPQSKIIWFHALRNALLPILTSLGLQFSVLLTGSLLVEIIFSLPGAAKWLLDAVHRQDYPVIHGGIFLIASIIIITNVLVELISFIVNPKLRKSS